MARVTAHSAAVAGAASSERGSAPRHRALLPKYAPIIFSAPVFKGPVVRTLRGCNQRAHRLTGRAAAGGQEVESEVDFDGQALYDLILERYGCSYDLNLVHRKALGMNIVALNVMWKYMGQRSFPLSEEEYLEKLDIIAEALRVWDQVDLVVSFLKSPRREKPRVSKAVSIQLDVDEELYLSFFGE